MAFQLDDLLKEDKKDANLLPDLSKAICNSQEEFRRLLENCPEFKIKPEKVQIINMNNLIQLQLYKINKKFQILIKLNKEYFK